MEMQGRQRDGIAWMRGNTEAWSRDSFFAVHNWWHLALYHLDLGEIDEVLALFDGPIYGARSRVILDMIDASAMLWRLHLRGIDVGDRWNAVADAWEPVKDAGNYAFNDAHAMMAFVGAGRRELGARVLEAQVRGDGSAAATTRRSPARSAGRSHRPSRRSATATTPRRRGCCARCATSPTASAAAMPSATCSTSR